ncbi:DUF397 domain-containing protein [Streptomyces sp. JW3]|uniref:DUF397 domain-containing protein n=1 Tax=Streptomyces sp. JW3 TaxID=3456955 RepID=UPI003FA49E6B
MSAIEPTWVKSSYSGGGGGNCVEVAVCPEPVPHAWFKSSYSGSSGDNCVEVAIERRTVLVRDSKDTARHPLTVSPDAWTAFTAPLNLRSTPSR